MLYTAILLLLAHRLRAVGMPDQASEDNTWGSLLAGRPFVRSLKVTTSTETQECWADRPLNNSHNNCTGNFSLTAVVSAYNLCAGAGRRRMATCYNSPNRVAISFVVPNGQGNVNNDLTAMLSDNDVIEATIDLNTLGQTLRWTWMNGQPVHWHAAGLDQPGGLLHVKLKPALQPNIDWSAYPGSGCTATPIFNCNVAASTGDTLSASMVLSLDDTLAAAFAGSVFGTTGSIIGFMMVAHSGEKSYELTYQLAGPHKNANGQDQLGRLKAFLPQSTLDLFGVSASAAEGNLTITRVGSEGQNGQVVMSALTAALFGTAGLLVDIPNITFSAPQYKLKIGATSSSSATLQAPAPGLLTLAFLTFSYLLSANV
eukprot:gb/GEZN01009932.1/.p1 GENE.gb/GEZN01009932.1/~~gb/GEZN01009932.1/.p1  ORF type:complete len:371 (-),score=19.27 gb/GEZN01009932.1/:121-1233(-)